MPTSITKGEAYKLYDDIQICGCAYKPIWFRKKEEKKHEIFG